jgi:hypothetical protein
MEQINTKSRQINNRPIKNKYDDKEISFVPSIPLSSFILYFFCVVQLDYQSLLPRDRMRNGVNYTQQEDNKTSGKSTDFR